MINPGLTIKAVPKKRIFFLFEVAFVLRGYNFHVICDESMDKISMKWADLQQ